MSILGAYITSEEFREYTTACHILKLQGCRISTVVSENVILDYLYSTILYYTILLYSVIAGSSPRPWLRSEGSGPPKRER